MPRKHKTPLHKPYTYPGPTGKKRYTTRRIAEKAAEHIMLTQPNVTITVYRELDGGWYLTSKNTPQT